MNYLTLEEIKQQCVIDSDFTDDDELLTRLGTAAEDLIEQLIDQPLYEVEAEKGEIPAGLKHAMLMSVDFFYSQNRGSGDESLPIPRPVEIITKLYRRFHK